MKFFPYDDEPLGDQLARYWAYVESLNGAIPSRLLELMDRSLGLDDGLLVRVRHNRKRRKLMLTLRCGNSRVGYYDLVFRYKDVRISLDHDRSLTRIARTTIFHRRYESDLHWHEFDVAQGGRIEHRLIFHRRGSESGVCIVFNCRSVDWERIPRPHGKLYRARNRYPGGIADWELA